MRNHTLRTSLLCTAVVLCVGAGTAVGVGLRRQATDETTAVVAAPSAPGETSADGSDPSVVAPDQVAGAPAGAGAPAPVGDDEERGGQDANEPNDEAGEVEGEIGEQAPPEGEERPPAWNPQVPELDLEPLPWPNWNPNPGNNGNGANGNGGGNAPADPPPPPPAPPVSPLDIVEGRLGPGPIYEANPRDCGPNAATRTGTLWTISIHQVPRSEPYDIIASAQAGGANGSTSVRRHPGGAFTYDIGYSFPRESVQAPTPIRVTVTVIDGGGNMHTESFGGRPGLGHQLYPWDHCR